MSSVLTTLSVEQDQQPILKSLNLIDAKARGIGLIQKIGNSELVLLDGFGIIHYFELKPEILTFTCADSTQSIEEEMKCIKPEIEIPPRFKLSIVHQDQKEEGSTPASSEQSSLQIIYQKESDSLKSPQSLNGSYLDQSSIIELLGLPSVAPFYNQFNPHNKAQQSRSLHFDKLNVKTRLKVENCLKHSQILVDFMDSLRQLLSQRISQFKKNSIEEIKEMKESAEEMVTLLKKGWLESEKEWRAVSLLFQHPAYHNSQVNLILDQFKLKIPALAELFQSYIQWQKTIIQRLNRISRRGSEWLSHEAENVKSQRIQEQCKTDSAPYQWICLFPVYGIIIEKEKLIQDMKRILAEREKSSRTETQGSQAGLGVNLKSDGLWSLDGVQENY